MNPFITQDRSVHGTVPFHLVQHDHFLPALDHCIALANERIDAIVENPAAPTFENTLEALEFSSLELDELSSTFFNLNSAETTPEIQTIAREFAPKLTAHSNAVLLNEGLFKRLRVLWETKEQLDLEPEQARLLSETYEGFVRRGAELKGEKKTQLKELSESLSKAALLFGEHVLADTQAFEWFSETGEALAGLPEYVMEAAKLKASDQGKVGYALGLDMPTYMAVMKYAQDRKLRQHFYLNYTSRAFADNANNNTAVVEQLVNQRLEKAQLLGFEHHAALTLGKRMAKDAGTVWEFIDSLKKVAAPACQRDLNELKDFAATKGLEGALEPWDFSFYAEQLKKERFSIDDELLKPYFKLDNVLDGAFQVAHKLYGLSFVENPDIPVYHDNVVPYEVYDAQGDFLSVLYTDFFPRTGKRAGAWMTSYRNQYVLNGNMVRPHISIVCNFTAPTPTLPSLLTFNEVLTLFHEFGHALHGMLANTMYPSMSGTSVYWDFVELPSQILENWCYEPEALALFARHYETGAVIPQEYVDRIREASTFMEGYMTLRQLNFAQLDMHWHTQTTPLSTSVRNFELEATADTSTFPPVDGTCVSTAFSHIFQGGYSAGYYSYKWAEVLDADAFDRFKQEGIFNPEVASAFKRILSKGGTIAPDELFETFRGRAPKVDALLRRSGLTS